MDEKFKKEETLSDTYAYRENVRDRRKKVKERERERERERRKRESLSERWDCEYLQHIYSTQLLMHARQIAARIAQFHFVVPQKLAHLDMAAAATTAATTTAILATAATTTAAAATTAATAGAA